MEMEIEELRRQRDLAQTQVDELRKKIQEDQEVFLSLPVFVSLTLSVPKIAYVNRPTHYYFVQTSGLKSI